MGRAVGDQSQVVSLAKPMMRALRGFANVPDPMSDPRGPGAALMTEWRELAGLTHAELAGHLQRFPGLGHVDERLVRLWESGICKPPCEAILATLIHVGHAGLIPLWSMLQQL